MSARKAKALLAVVPDEPNDRAVIGGNQPPEPIEPTPYAAAKARIDDLVSDLRISADGAKVETQELCDYFANIEAMLRTAVKDADAARKAENKEFDDGKAEVQARYNLLIGETKSVTGSAILAIETAKKIQEPFLVRRDAAIAAEAKRLKDIADAATLAAQEALRATSVENLAGREAAEALVQEAKTATIDANRMERTTAKSGGVFGRSTSLRTVYTATLIPATETEPDGAMKALRHFCLTRSAEVRGFLQSMADVHVRTGDHTADEIPGFKITSKRKI